MKNKIPYTKLQYMAFYNKTKLKVYTKLQKEDIDSMTPTLWDLLMAMGS